MNDSARAIPLAPAPSTLDSRGLTAAVAAFLSWGLFPLFLYALRAAPVLQVTAHRVVWAFFFAIAWLALKSELGHLRTALADPKIRWRLLLSATFIAINWLIVNWGIATHHVVEISLGYFIGPLLNVALGVILFRERLNWIQWLAVGIAASGVVYLAVVAGHAPWMSIMLALSFGLYGLVRKVTKVEALVGFGMETLFLLPIVAGYLIWCEVQGTGVVHDLSAMENLLLVLGGPYTALPLVWFAFGARRIPLSTIGLLQYIAPSLHLITALVVFHEPFSLPRFIGFSMIWAALAIYGIDGWVERRRSATA